MTNFVLVVPKQTLNGLLVSWLGLSDVGRLDSALCDRACREIFEHSLTLRSFDGTTGALCAKFGFIRWVIKRKVKLENLFIQSNLLRTKNLKVRHQLFTVVGPSLRRAVIRCDKDVNFNSAYFTENDNYADSECDSGSDSESDQDYTLDIDREAEETQNATQNIETELIDEVIVDLSMQCSKLETFAVLGQHSGSVIALLQMNPNLRDLTTSKCPKTLRCIGTLCPNITCVKIEEIACSVDLEVFTSNIPSQLQRLCLPETDVGKSFLKPVLACSSLIELRVNTVPFDWTTLAITCPNLEVFRCTVNSHKDMTDFVAQLANVMPSLRTLILMNGCDPDANISSSLFAKVLESFPLLRQYCADSDYEDRLSNLPRAPRDQAVSSVPVLEELYVGNNRNFYNWEEVLLSCPALRSVGSSFARGKMGALAAAGVRKIVNLDMSKVYDYAEYSGLHELDIALCRNLTDRGLKGVAKNCPQLTLLHVHDAPKVTVQGVMVVLNQCVELRSVECVDQRKGKGKSQRVKSAVAAVVALCKMQYPQLQHMRLRFV